MGMIEQTTTIPQYLQYSHIDPAWDNTRKWYLKLLRKLGIRPESFLLIMAFGLATWVHPHWVALVGPESTLEHLVVNPGIALLLGLAGSLMVWGIVDALTTQLYRLFTRQRVRVYLDDKGFVRYATSDAYPNDFRPVFHFRRGGVYREIWVTGCSGNMVQFRKEGDHLRVTRRKVGSISLRFDQALTLAAQDCLELYIIVVWAMQFPELERRAEAAEAALGEAQKQLVQTELALLFATLTIRRQQEALVAAGAAPMTSSPLATSIIAIILMLKESQGVTKSKIGSRARRLLEAALAELSITLSITTQEARPVILRLEEMADALKQRAK